MLLADHQSGTEVALGDYSRGAAFVTDLVNTVAGLRAADTLTSVAELRSLLTGHAGLAESARLGASDLEEVRELRGRLLSALEAPDDRSAAASLNAMLEATRHAVGLSHGHWTVSLRADAPLAERLQVTSALTLLAVVKSLGSERFRACAADDCSGVFVDTTRAGRRKYCRPAVCGNRHNVAAYRARRTTRLP
jgi:predicted RNA-binding Zn ribbon-like protein